MADKKLLLIDGNSVAFRAFYALYRQLESFKSPDGLHTNAIYAFKNMLDVLLKDVDPTHVLVAFDAGKVTFRTKMYGEYKADVRKLQRSYLNKCLIFKKCCMTWALKPMN